MTPTSAGEVGADPRELVESLNQWAERTDWVDWVEIGGSLGRGGGDALSDVDAGIGVKAPADSDERIAAVLAAIETFAPVAASLKQPYQAGTTHLICAYRDGRQLSLVVFDETSRTGLPPQTLSTVDKSNRHSQVLDRSRWDADERTVREWTFLAWIAIGDSARHRHRGRTWRALASLTEARDHLWKLWAHTRGLVFPMRGVVAVENADAELPPGIEATHPRDLGPESFHRALESVGRLLAPYTEADLRDLAETVDRRLALLLD